MNKDVKSAEFTEYVNEFGISCVGVRCNYPAGLVVKCLESDDFGEQIEFHYLVEGLLESELGASWDPDRGYILAANGGDGFDDESVKVVKEFFLRYGFEVTERKTKSEREPELAAVRQRIAELEAELSSSPKDVALLTELMKAYQTVGDERHRLEVMRVLRDIPSQKDLQSDMMSAARSLVAEIVELADGELVDVDELRAKHASLFALVESRASVRPGDVMAACGCGCGFAIKVLQTFHRLGIVSEDRNLGLRDVATPLPAGRQRLRSPVVSASTEQNDNELERIRELVRLGGEVSAAQIQRLLGVGYNRACVLLEQAGSCRRVF